MVFWYLLLVAVLFYAYFKIIYYRMFPRYNVTCIPPAIFFGNMLLPLNQDENIAITALKAYCAFPLERFSGFYEIRKGVVLLRDPELIKKVTVKDFDHFVDRRPMLDPKSDPLFAKSLFALTGQDWRDMRPILSPAFTSAKMKLMIPFMIEMAEQMNTSLLKKIQDAEEGYIPVDVRELANRYAADVIASCTFGLKTDSHADENNQFYLEGKKASSYSSWQLVKMILLSSCPLIKWFMNVRIFSKATREYYMKLVLNIMKEREENNVVRQDIINLLMEARKGMAPAGQSEGSNTARRNWTDMELVAQAVIFFIGGFDTVSTCISFLLHELALNPIVQNRLHREIIETEKKTGGKIDYNTIKEMKYMDMVVSETLRLWPPLTSIDRVCVKDYNIGIPNEIRSNTEYIVRKGTGVLIPLYAIHRDIRLYKDANKFYPERFAANCRHLIRPTSYMPFGMGPRNCIGARFALCEVKIMVYHLIKTMEVLASSRTNIPLELAPDHINPRVKGGDWLIFRKRDNVATK